MSFSRVCILVFLSFIFESEALGQMNPKYAATVGGEWSGKMKRSQFLAQQGVGAFKKMTAEHWEKIIVNSFQILIIRDTSMVLHYVNHGNVFEEKLKSLLKDIRSNDRILIYDIYGSDYDKSKVYISPLEYKIE